MTIKTRIEKLEQRHRPDDEITVRIVHIGTDGTRYDYHTGEPLPPANPGDTVINVTWGDEDNHAVFIPDNGRS